MNIQLLFGLGAGHVIGDFVLQAGWMVRAKKDWRVRLAHVMIVVLVSYVLAGFWPLWWVIIPALTGVHFVIDTVKVRLDKAASGGASALLFAIDQGAHVVSVLCLASVASSLAWRMGSDTESWWVAALGHGYIEALILVTGFVLAARASGLFLAVALPRRDNGAREQGGPDGFFVGVVERTLVFAAILAGRPAAVVLILVVKMAYATAWGRLGQGTRRILCGTSASFALGLAIGFATRYAMNELL